MCASQKEEDTKARNVMKVANRCVFSMIRGSGCSKSRLAKAAGTEVAVQQRNEKCHAAVAKRIFKSKCAKHRIRGPIFEVQMWKNGTPLWREAHLQVKKCETPAFWHNFGASDVEKVPERRDRLILNRSINLSVSWSINQFVNESVRQLVS